MGAVKKLLGDKTDSLELTTEDTPRKDPPMSRVEKPNRSGDLFVHMDEVEAGKKANRKSVRAYINVAYKDRDLAKNLGAKWDPNVNRWYVPAGSKLTKIYSWRK